MQRMTDMVKVRAHELVARRLEHEVFERLKDG